MTKPTEKQLHATLLDIKYASDLQTELIEELVQTLKEARARKRITSRTLKKAINYYRSIYEREPFL